MNRLHSHTYFAASSRQSGIALITVLVLLVIVTLLAVSAGRNATQGELLARANRARQISIQAAEAALVDARLFLLIDKVDQGLSTMIDAEKSGSLFTVEAPTPGYYTFTGQPVWQNAPVWITRGARTVTAAGPVTSFYSGGSAGVSKQPEYIIERLRASETNGKGDEFFRITARGFGPTAGTVSIVQETVMRKYDGKENKL